MLTDIFAMSNSAKAQGYPQLLASAIACVSVTKTLFQLAAVVVENNEAAIAAAADECPALAVVSRWEQRRRIHRALVATGPDNQFGRQSARRRR